MVPHDDLMKAARRWADQILECAPLSVRASKQSVIRGLDQSSLREAIRGRYDQVLQMIQSEDFFLQMGKMYQVQILDIKILSQSSNPCLVQIFKMN